MDYKNKNIKNHKNIEQSMSLTSEALLKNKSKWELFLEGYKNHHNEDFSWPEYIKKCKIRYGEFDIKGFINNYGKECEEDFKRFRNEILEEKGLIKKNPNESDKLVPMIEFDEKILELMVNGDNLRTRMLIDFLNPETREGKKRLKKSWKQAKRQKQTKREWMKTYVGIPFKAGRPDPQDTKYTRDEIFEMIRDAKKRLNDLKIKKRNSATRQMNFTIETPSKAINVSNIAELKHLNKGIDDLSIFQPTIKFSALTNNFSSIEDEKDLNNDTIHNINNEIKNENNISNKLDYESTIITNNESSKNEDNLITIQEETQKITDDINFFKIPESISNNATKNVSEDNNLNELNNDSEMKINNIDLIETKIVDNSPSEIDRSNYLTNLLKIEKNINDQIDSIKNDNELIRQELYKTNRIKQEEERKYELLKKQKEELTRTILMENENYLK
ncbi:DUF5454 family protein [Mycoplasmoides alvi]|uniref:DUF5454 family protein n=1 Tax=Mycoplasmoides alvi TaxID=78580 RepID=UPI000697AEF5|nr:DUF5454 family protein [Mycoplasmoides alvi]